MKRYDISNLLSGKYLGEWPGETPDDAVRAMDRAAGYSSDEDVLDDFGFKAWAGRMADLIVTTITYYVSDYGPDGSYVSPNPFECGTLQEARDEVRRRLGDLEPWRKWSGIADDGDVEAYHASRDEDCGGIAISKE